MKHSRRTVSRVGADPPLPPSNSFLQDSKSPNTEQGSPGIIRFRSPPRRLPKKSSNATVMVIDDELPILDLFKKFFSLAAVKVQVFSNPRHAADWYREHWQHIKLVFLDMKNPAMSGEDCFGILQGINPDVHIALISGSVEPKIVDQLMRQGALCLFTKPFYYPGLINWALQQLGLPVHKSPVTLAG